MQVIPRAAGGVRGARVKVIVEALRDGHVGLCPVAVGPADRAKTVLTEREALHILRDAGA